MEIEQAANPLISVLMPVYNGEKYLKEAIRSILDQEFSDFEFLIVDDGSEDSSYEIITSYSDPRIRILRNERNLGLIASLNSGIQKCRGRYIARMDCDDISLPGRLARQFAFMEEHPEIGISGTWIIASDTGEVIRYPESHDECFTYKFFNSPLAHPTVIMRTDVILKNKLWYSAEYPVCEDIELWQRALHYTEFGNLNEPLLAYRIHESSVSVKFKTTQEKSLHQYYRTELNVLGIACGSRDEELHYSLIRPEVNNETRSKFSFSEYYLWTEKIIQANSALKLFPEEDFRRLLKVRFITVSYNYIKHKSTWYWYHRSALTRSDFFCLKLLKYSFDAVFAIFFPSDQKLKP
jgi:glycosyltransferase involved in cell wall biosynthesis